MPVSGRRGRRKRGRESHICHKHCQSHGVLHTHVAVPTFHGEVFISLRLSFKGGRGGGGTD